MLKLAKSRNPWARVIFMTAHSTWDRISEAIELGAADYLMKPLQPSELRLLVTQECERTLRWKQALRRSLAMARA